VGEKGMGRLDAAALAIHLGPRVSTIEPNMLDTRAREHPKRALATLLFQPLHDVLIDLGVPGEIELARLEHSSRCGDGISASLQLHRVEEGPVGHVIVRIDLVAHHIPRLEFDDLVRPRAYRLEVIWRIARVLPCVLGEEMPGQNQTPSPGPGYVPAGGWLCKHHLDR